MLKTYLTTDELAELIKYYNSTIRESLKDRCCLMVFTTSVLLVVARFCTSARLFRRTSINLNRGHSTQWQTEV